MDGNSDMDRRIGHVVRTLRLRLGLSQKQLSSRMGKGISQGYLSMLESGRHSWSRESLEELAVALNLVNAEDLLGIAGYPGHLGKYGSRNHSHLAARPDDSFCQEVFDHFSTVRNDTITTYLGRDSGALMNDEPEVSS